MTPQERWEYKLRWPTVYHVVVHSDLGWVAQRWCRQNLPQHVWSISEWTDLYEHTYSFENYDHSVAFKIALGLTE